MNNKNLDKYFQERFEGFEVEPPKKIWRDITYSLNKVDIEKKSGSTTVKFATIAASLVVGLILLDALFVKENNQNEKKDLVSNDLNQIKPEQKIKANKFNIARVTKNRKLIINKYIKSNENKNAIPTRQKNYDDKTKNQVSEVTVSESSNLPIENNFSYNEIAILSPSTVIINDNKKEFEFIPLFKAQEKLESTPIVDSKQNYVAGINELDEILQKLEEEKKTKTKEQLHNWSVRPNVAAIYLDPNLQAQAIDSQFANNDKGVSANMGIGIGVNYAISKKIQIRSGVNKFAMGYVTKDVNYSVGLTNSQLTNVTSRQNNNVRFISESGASITEKPGEKTPAIYKGDLDQKMEYYEIPLEVSYNILNRKFGVNAIAGMSTMLLDNNRITLSSSETKVEIGEANNLQEVNFSTNIGLGFYYKFAKSFQANFDPMVKYQLNTFNSNSNSTSAFLGLYTGLSYVF